MMAAKWARARSFAGAADEAAQPRWPPQGLSSAAGTGRTVREERFRADNGLWVTALIPRTPWSTLTAKSIAPRFDNGRSSRRTRASNVSDLAKSACSTRIRPNPREGFLADPITHSGLSNTEQTPGPLTRGTRQPFEQACPPSTHDRTSSPARNRQAFPAPQASGVAPSHRTIFLTRFPRNMGPAR
jgi:hypothetical protein